jgi:hypothetical protein
VRKSLVLTLLSLASISIAQDFTWAPTKPGRALGQATAGEASVQNGALKIGLFGNGLKIENKWTSEWTDFGPNILRLVMRNGKVILVTPGDKRGIMALAGQASSSRAAGKREGRSTIVPFAVESIGLSGYWRLSLRNDSAYARIEVFLKGQTKDVDISEVDLLRFGSKSAQVAGKTPGSPVVIGNTFVGFEHPMSVSQVANGVVTCGMRRALPIHKGASITYSAVVGVAAPGQLRRSFLSYVESERAHPYRPFLHYNSWYDIGYFTPYNATDCLDRIGKFGKELVQKRGVKMDSFLFDDGWDNYNSVWNFHSGFPEGFLPLRNAAAEFKAGPGVWLSPWGGYGDPRKKRLAFGKAHGMEVDSQGYALSGPNYYKRFHDVTMDFVTNQGINQFKFDGTGSPDKTTPGSQFDSDFDAAISLIGDLRKARPDLFVNLTTGTWPSPFWLRYADSTWRGGSDHSFAGVGTFRQQWMTYKDGDTFHGVVERGPLYPLNSLMLHGLIYAQHAQHLNTDPGNDFRDEVHDYFGNGTQLQEMYITPDLLTSQNWDDLAEGANWSRANADVLRDTHWVGGDPTKLEVYGWASWSPRKAILVLRNPSDKQQAFSVDIASVLELPTGFAKAYRGTSPWKSDASSAVMQFPVGASLVVDLKPFEVRVMDLEAQK